MKSWDSFPCQAISASNVFLAMNMFCRVFQVIVLIMLAAPIELSAQQRDPKIGYVYPAGGRQGTTFQVLIGGRQVARSKEVIISGHGVRGRIIRGIPSMRINDADERRVINRLYLDARKKLEGDSNSSFESGRKEERKNNSTSQKNDAFRKNGNQESGTSEPAQPEKLPTPEDVIKKYPYLDRLADPTVRDIELIYDFYFSPRPERKPVEALGQGVMVEITIDSDAEPGDRDLRLLTANGLTTPVRFMVGTVPEVMEREPNDPDSHVQGRIIIWDRQVKDAPKSLSERHIHDLPVVLNGQIRAGDIDRFQFKARRGQKLVVDVRARHLTPYLADGVPGWFQANISLFDPSGKKLGEAMSYRHEADPVLLVEIPENGVYTLEIQDSIFRGRDDFVYRMTVGELPFVTSMFPLGVRSGKTAGADVDGWNLPEKAILFDAEKLETGIHEISSIGNGHLLRPLRFVVDDLPERNEKEPNNDFSMAEKTKWPMIVNGRLSDENDVDCFTFEGRKGQRIVLDVTARSLDSPLDAVVELLDSQGKVIAMNDDRADSNGPNIGLETHHADPYLNVELPADGNYVVRLYDATQNGGKEYCYRLRISPPRPDFSVFCEPSSLTFRGDSMPVKIHLVRKDGFEGEVKLRTTNESGFRGEDGTGTVAVGTTETTAQLSPARSFRDGTTDVFIEAVAVIDGREIVHPVVAVDDWEQAFIYHHWVPAATLRVSAERTDRKRLHRKDGKL